MPVVIENLHRGDYISVLEYLEERPDQQVWGQASREVDGYPFKVVATSAPFIMVEDAVGNVRSLDIRAVSLTKLSKQYGDYVHNHPNVKHKLGHRTSSRKTKRVSSKKKTAEEECPRCNARLVQRMEFANKEMLKYCWRWVCPRCGFDNGLVQSTPDQ